VRWCRAPELDAEDARRLAAELLNAAEFSDAVQ
jgi:hypothetical protein